MHRYVKCTFLSLAFFTFLNYIQTTIDINEAELQYLADHLLPEECRKLVASAHIKTYQQPNMLEQGERKVPKEVPCFDLLLHWNSVEKEGKGESHNFLEHRLRQIDRPDLADWLGKTVFKELTVDLNESVNEDFKALGDDNVTVEEDTDMPIFQAPLKPEDLDVTEWTTMDSVCYSLIIVVVVMIFAVCIHGCYLKIKRRKARSKSRGNANYERFENPSDTESEDKFDIRNRNFESG